MNVPSLGRYRDTFDMNVIDNSEYGLRRAFQGGRAVKREMYSMQCGASQAVEEGFADEQRLGVSGEEGGRD